MSTNVFSWNRSQALIHIINANVTHNLWPRGNGKTEGGAGPRIIHLSNVMPRCQIIFYSDTYERIEGTLMPNITGFFKNHMGLIEDEDFVVFKKPPDHWIKPYNTPRKFDRVVSFKSGLALCCAASFKDGSANGFNAQAAIIDETKFVPQHRIKSQLYKALRGQFKLYGHLPEYRSVWSFSDKFEGDVEWILKLRDKQDPKLISAVLTLALEVEKLKLENANPAIAESTWYKNRQRITYLESKLNPIRRELVYVCDATPFENKEILGEKFYRDAKRDCKSIYEYNIAILNKDPDQVEHTFYPTRNPYKHYYKDAYDTTEEQPLCVAMDYQWRITPMVVGQWGRRPNKVELTFNIVNALHTLHPDGGIEKTVEAFCDYYKDRVDKLVYYLFDHTAKGRRPDGASFKETAVKKWISLGWTVIEIDMGQAPEHDLKHEEFKTILGEDRVMFNELRTANTLLLSIKGAGTKTENKKTKKDKSGEKNLSKDPVKQTDYSDAFDQLIWGVIKMRLVSSYNGTFTDITTK